MKLENYYNPDYAGLQQYPLNLSEVELLHNLIKEKNEINLSSVEHYYDNNKAVIDESVDRKLMTKLSKYIKDKRVLKGIKYLLYRYNVDTEYVNVTQRLTYDKNSIAVVDKSSYFHFNITRIIPSYNLIGESLLSSILTKLTIWRYVDSHWNMSFTKLLVNALIDIHTLDEKKRLVKKYYIEEVFDIVYSAYYINVEEGEKIYSMLLKSSWNEKRITTGISVPKSMNYHSVLSKARKSYAERFFNVDKTIKENLELINLEIDKDYPNITCLHFNLRTLKTIISESVVIKEMKDIKKEVKEIKKSIGISKKAQKEIVVKLYHKLKEDGHTTEDILKTLKRKGHKVSRRSLYRWISNT